MKKLITLLLCICSICCIVLTNSVKAEGYIQLNPTDDYIYIGDGDFYYTQAFQKTSNYDYLQLHVEEILRNSVRFCLEKRQSNGQWVPESLSDSGRIFPYYYLDNDGGDDTYIMYCGGTSNNYANPPGVSTSQVKSVLAGDQYAIESGETYRIIMVNPSQWNGKTAKVKCSIEFMNCLGD